MNRGWRFCRFNGVVNRVVSCWSLVSPAPPFCLVLGPYWTTSGLQTHSGPVGLSHRGIYRASTFRGRPPRPAIRTRTGSLALAGAASDQSRRRYADGPGHVKGPTPWPLAPLLPAAPADAPRDTTRAFANRRCRLAAGGALRVNRHTCNVGTVRARLLLLEDDRIVRGHHFTPTSRRMRFSRRAASCPWPHKHPLGLITRSVPRDANVAQGVVVLDRARAMIRASLPVSIALMTSRDRFSKLRSLRENTRPARARCSRCSGR